MRKQYKTRLVDPTKLQYGAVDGAVDWTVRGAVDGAVYGEVSIK